MKLSSSLRRFVLSALVASTLAASTLAAAPALAGPDKPDATPTEAALAQSSALWAARASVQNQELVARQFLDMLVLDGSIRKPILLNVANLAKDNPRAAFDNYTTYFLDHLKNADYNDLGEALKNQEAGDKAPDKAAMLRVADDLMKGIANFGSPIHIGEPGQVDWSTPWDKNVDRPANPPLHTASIFLPLADAYLLTGDRKYLDRWTAYLDDWTLNDTYFDHLHPLMVPDGINSNSGNSVRVMLRLISRIQNPALGEDEKIAPRILAQVIHRFLLEMLPYPVTYIRSNTHNWTPSIGLIQIAKIFEDFKSAQLYFREARRRNIEDNAVTQNLRDGTENQQDHWYNPQYLKVGAVQELLDAGSTLPGWKELQNDYVWRQELHDHLQDRVTWLIHDRSGQNALPIPWNGGYVRTPETGTYADSPEAFQDLTNRTILQAVNGDADADPGYDSEWFPYGGFNIVRDGWTRNDGYGALFCSPSPGAYGGYRSRSNNNTFGLNAYGQDLLIDDATGHYMYPSSPLRVDGRNQFFHAGVYKVPSPSAHKVFQVNAWWQPADWRWHASQNFNLMEGVYSGAYAEPTDAKSVQGPYGTDQSQSGTMPRGAGINDVTHQRLAMYVRGAKLWIITDHLFSHGTHEYSQQWIIPLRPADSTPPVEIRTPASFDAAKITLDEKSKKIATNEPTVPLHLNGKMLDAPKVNLSLYQFSAMPLEYSSTVEPRGKEYNYYMYYSRDRVQAKWKGEGDQQVVTLIFPRAPGTGAEGDLKSSKQITGGKNAVGFEATTPDDQTVKYLASTTKDDALTLDNVSIQGEALLLSGNQGMALGASKMAIGGKAVNLPTPDFEFELNGNGATQFTPIYRPIAPVEIGPQSDVFADRVLVTLSSKTPGVQIHYTTDGSDPTPQSPLYTQPVALTQDTLVKARAYRPGVTKNPLQMSGTQATVASTAVFNKEKPVAGIKTPRPNPGLKVNYYEGDWKQLFFNFDEQKPKATGNAASLWDTSIIPADNPFVEGKSGARSKPYALEYSGFLNIPTTGVYTLRAPDEYVWPATEAGYDLRVWLGNEMGKGVFAGRVVGVSLWYPSTRMHAFGTWSVTLEKGIHPFRVVFIDYRTDAAKQLNSPGLNKYVWDGTTPDLKISGPDLREQPIPNSWLLRPMER